VIVGAAALVAAAATVALVSLTRDHVNKPEAKAPPIYLYFGVRQDAEARALLRAKDLYERGGRAEAGTIFARYSSPEAKVGAAFAAWPDTLPRLQALPQRKAVVRLHEGIALAAEGDQRGARRELEAATRVEPDTPYAVRSDDFLHPRSVPGLPPFVPSTPFPKRLAKLPPPQQFAALEREAKRSGHSTTAALLRYGSALQRLGHPLSARRVFDGAARADPGAETLTAAAVARFDKDAPERAFSRLGPLSARFRGAQTVRFHLGVLLLWIGDLSDGKKQLLKAVALGPKTPLGKEAKRFLDRL
jgi:tetratricopeptide (TPR) repeat protein